MKTSTWTAAYAKVFVTALLAATLAHFISSTTSGDAAPVPAVTMTVPSGSTTTRSIQACGSALADLLKKVCRNGYNAPPPLSNRSDHRTQYSRNDDDDGREKRAITRECCLHPCTLADLLQYCNIASSKNDLWPHHSVGGGGGGGGGGGCVVDGNTNTNASTTASVPTTSTRRGRTDTGLGLGVGATRINSPRRWPPEASTLPNTVDSNQWNVKAKPSGAIYFRQQNKPSSFTIAIAKAKANEKPQG
ncbi:uncharacterized protein LOC135846220 isoform X2 [Planococcus citri]|uniref:uncharacterized protein LOC135846220 isoform X2 n=1 Tax=Planococcus citri TaxID=170843 RepID=UPI0031F7A631